MSWMIIYLVRLSPDGSSVLPSIVSIRAGNPQTMVYMNLQLPVGTARRSPGGWWSLAPPSHPYRRPAAAVVFFCPDLLSPIASIFRSGTPCAARTFLPHPSGCRRQAGTLLSEVQSYSFLMKRQKSDAFFIAFHQKEGLNKRKYFVSKRFFCNFAAVFKVEV